MDRQHHPRIPPPVGGPVTALRPAPPWPPTTLLGHDRCSANPTTGGGRPRLTHRQLRQRFRDGAVHLHGSTRVRPAARTAQLVGARRPTRGYTDRTAAAGTPALSEAVSIYWKLGRQRGRAPTSCYSTRSATSGGRRFGWERSLLALPGPRTRSRCTTPPVSSGILQRVRTGATLNVLAVDRARTRCTAHIRNKWKPMTFSTIGFPTERRDGLSPRADKRQLLRAGRHLLVARLPAPSPCSGQISVMLYTGHAVRTRRWTGTRASDSDEPYAVLGAINPTAKLHDPVQRLQRRRLTVREGAATQKNLLYAGARPTAINPHGRLMLGERLRATPDQYTGTSSRAPIAARAAGVTARRGRHPRGRSLTWPSPPGRPSRAPSQGHQRRQTNLLNTGDGQERPGHHRAQSPKQLVGTGARGRRPGSALGVQYIGAGRPT
jgi:hypothetical protein